MSDKRKENQKGSLPDIFFSKSHIEAIIKECQRLAAISVEDPGFAKPYLEIIEAITIIKNRDFPSGRTIVIPHLED